MAYETYKPHLEDQNANSNFSEAMLNAYPDDMVDALIFNDGRRIDIYDIMNTAVMVKILKNKQSLKICGISNRIEDRVVPDIEKKTKWKLEKL